MPKITIFVVPIICLLYPNHLIAASFDCHKASTRVEKLVCENSELSSLDTQLGGLYLTAISSAKEKATVQREQRQWLIGRDTCQNVACLKYRYLYRIALLKPGGVPPPKTKMAEISNALRDASLRLGPNSNESMCKSLLSDFIRQKHIRHLMPTVQSDDYHSAGFTRYQNKCPKLDFHKTRRRPDHFPLPPNGQTDDTYYITYQDTKNMQLYEVDLDGNPQNGNEIIFYGEASKNDSDGSISNPVGGIYRAIKLKGCTNLGGVSVRGGWSPTSQIKNWNGVFSYKTNSGVYDLNLYPAGQYANGTPHGPKAHLDIYLWRQDQNSNQHHFGLACSYLTPASS